MTEYEKYLDKIRERMNQPDLFIDVDKIDEIVWQEFDKDRSETDFKLIDLCLKALVALRKHKPKSE